MRSRNAGRITLDYDVTQAEWRGRRRSFGQCDRNRFAQQPRPGRLLSIPLPVPCSRPEPAGFRRIWPGHPCSAGARRTNAANPVCGTNSLPHLVARARSSHQMLWFSPDRMCGEPLREPSLCRLPRPSSCPPKRQDLSPQAARHRSSARRSAARATPSRVIGPVKMKCLAAQSRTRGSSDPKGASGRSEGSPRKRARSRIRG